MTHNTASSRPSDSDSKAETTKTNEAPGKLNVGRELADTTWRMAVPVVLFAGLGIIADRSLATKPWLTLLGTIIGFAGASVLIRYQLRRWPAPLPKPGSYERNRKAGEKEYKDYYND